jgi:hypothetical protein
MTFVLPARLRDVVANFLNRPFPCNRRCCARRWRRSVAPCCAASRCRPGAPSPSAAVADVSVPPLSEGATQMGRCETVYQVVS